MRGNIVKDQQPAIIEFEPAFHRGDEKWLIKIAGLLEAEQPGQGRQIGADLYLIVAIYKYYRLILPTIFIGVLDRQIKRRSIYCSRQGNSPLLIQNRP